ncbi:type II toxin-antitoxin system VapC family toxin [Arcicella aquatica]|uniref:Type II toxin-antitoxin system VapC family toxin n=1 Tax=Arcicella aquatica TaxID=217141 RepID=A0ABU5QHW7_9BACT|nr:type II toxin-antitoxin system VapC family toxin [Arcicella aquatica]MEA5256424.1 type II toxin-antitoxin system VapC family toxin [Arcicella aquatica]
MKLLLDTHTFIWFVENDLNLPGKLKTEIENPVNEIYISVVSLWEIAVKVSLGKLAMTIDIPKLIIKIEECGFFTLPILAEHIVCVSSLPFHHREPFDRMLIAQTLCEKMTIVSRDGSFSEYHVDLLW